MVQKVICSKAVVRETQRKWTEKLKKIGLNQIKRVRTFAKGNFAHVSLVQLNGHPDSAFALKTMQKSKIKSKVQRKSVLMEKQILSEVQSDFVVKMYGTFKDKKYLHILTEYCPGGNLSLRGRLVGEKVAKFYTACIVEALDSLHTLNIAHNDLKPANLVLDEEGYVKLIDMGLSEKLQCGEKRHTVRGTVQYMSPEIAIAMLNKTRVQGRDRSVDLWALGALLYRFLAGKTPFQDKTFNSKNTCSNIAKGIESVGFPDRWFSEESKQFIQELCAYLPERRLGYNGIEEIRKHRWFHNFDWIALRSKKLQAPEIPKIDSVLDTRNYGVEVVPDTDGAEDYSDWDEEF